MATPMISRPAAMRMAAVAVGSAWLIHAGRPTAATTEEKRLPDGSHIAIGRPLNA